jgi:hypothetical protein
MEPVLDKKLWKQCKNLVVGMPRKPAVLPNRVGAMVGLEKDPYDVTIVTLVDGDHVKIKYNMDFTEVDTEMHCPDFVEGIWIDANTPMKEWPFYLYRAAHEYRDMCQDQLSYEVAKVRAQKGERELRMDAWNDQGKAL